MAKRLTAARQAFVDAVEFVVANAKSDPNAAFAGSVPYLLLAGNLVAGWQLGRALLVAEAKLAAGEDVEFMHTKIAVARFYAEHVLTRVPGLRDSVVDGAAAINDVSPEASERSGCGVHGPRDRGRACARGPGPGGLRRGMSAVKNPKAALQAATSTRAETLPVRSKPAGAECAAISFRSAARCAKPAPISAWP
jgi:hypothetical protein